MKESMYRLLLGETNKKTSTANEILQFHLTMKQESGTPIFRCPQLQHENCLSEPAPEALIGLEVQVDSMDHILDFAKVGANVVVASPKRDRHRRVRSLDTELRTADLGDLEEQEAIVDAIMRKVFDKK